MNEGLQERIIQYVLGELEGSTLRETERLLQTEVEARVFAVQTFETLGWLSLAYPMVAPLGLAEWVLAQERSRKVKRVSFVPWAAAACLAFGLLGAGVDRYRLVREIHALRAENSVAAWQIASLRSQVGSYPQASAVVLWNQKEGFGVIQLESLPPARQGKDYQLWLVDPTKPAPVNVGVVPIHNERFTRIEFRPDHPVSGAAKFVLSLESSGGVPEPVGPVLFIGAT